MSILSCAFYLGDTVQTAQRLLGKYVVRMLDGQALVARITETEAYVGRMDKAAHAYNYRQTARNAAMFGPPGHAYVYMIYGMHHCLNFVTEPEGEPSAVLLRGLEPVYGLDEMARQHLPGPFVMFLRCVRVSASQVFPKRSRAISSSP